MGKYIVKAEGKVLDVRDHAYSVVASNKNEAQKIAEDMFLDEYPVYNSEYKTKVTSIVLPTIISLIALTIAILPTFIRWTDGHAVISLRPTLITSLFGIGMYAAYVVRFKGVQNMFQTWTDIAFCPLLTLLFSSFAAALFASKTLNIFTWNLQIDTKIILLIALILSWLGLKMVSVVCMLVVFLLALSNLTGLSAAMGSIYGTIYIIASFIGMLAYMVTEPAFHYGMRSMGGSLGRSAARFGEDLRETGKTIKDKGSELVNTKKNNGKVGE